MAGKRHKKEANNNTEHRPVTRCGKEGYETEEEEERLLADIESQDGYKEKDMRFSKRKDSIKREEHNEETNREERKESRQYSRREYERSSSRNESRSKRRSRSRYHSRSRSHTRRVEKSHSR